MTYTVTGTIAGRIYSVTYRKLPLLKPKLTGDRVAVDIVTIVAQTTRDLLGPVGMTLKPPYLNDPLAALFVMLEVFDEILEATGEVPEAPDVPDGAIC